MYIYVASCSIQAALHYTDQSLGMKVGKRSLSDVTTRTKISAYIESLSSSTGRWQAAQPGQKFLLRFWLKISLSIFNFLSYLSFAIISNVKKQSQKCVWNFFLLMKKMRRTYFCPPARCHYYCTVLPDVFSKNSENKQTSHMVAFLTKKLMVNTDFFW